MSLMALKRFFKKLYLLEPLRWSHLSQQHKGPLVEIKITFFHKYRLKFKRNYKLNCCNLHFKTITWKSILRRKLLHVFAHDYFDHHVSNLKACKYVKMLYNLVGYWYSMCRGHDFTKKNYVTFFKTLKFRNRPKSKGWALLLRFTNKGSSNFHVH